MGLDSNGDYILAATKNVRFHRELTDNEKEAAATLAPLVRQVERNWVPILVREISTFDFLLIGSPVMLEAVKMAGLDIVYCIQIGDDKETALQVEKAGELLFGSTPAPEPEESQEPTEESTDSKPSEAEEEPETQEIQETPNPWTEPKTPSEQLKQMSLKELKARAHRLLWVNQDYCRGFQGTKKVKCFMERVGLKANLRAKAGWQQVIQYMENQLPRYA